MAYLVNEDDYDDSGSPTSSEYSDCSSKENTAPEDGYRPSSPTESDHSLSPSFSSIATTEFLQFLADIEFTPADMPSEMVPPRFLYAIIRGRPTDLFEEPREEVVQIERMPGSYLDWVEYGIPLSRFLFAEYWISRRLMRGWDAEDARETREFEELKVRMRWSVPIKEETRGNKDQQDWFDRSGCGISIRHKSSSLAFSSIRFASLEDDRRSTWWFSSDGHSFIDFDDDKSDGRKYGLDSPFGPSAISSSSSSIDSHANTSSTEIESTATLAQEYRKRFGGSWNVVQMAGGKIPRYVEEMQAGIMRRILGHRSP